MYPARRRQRVYPNRIKHPLQVHDQASSGGTCSSNKP
uniref:Uncharacterized protein n=1 Tax=Anguilla anguilla TaxID=7936 RepID=A0A0E9XTL3_ANGAN